MPFTNSADAAFARQAVLDARDLERMEGAHQRTGVLRGLTVTSNANTTVNVATGSVVLRGTQAPPTAANTALSVTVDGTNPRWGLVKVDGTTGVLSMLMGTAAASPVRPTPGADDVVVAAVYVEAGDTNIATNQLEDKRVKVPGRLINPQEVTWGTSTDHTDLFAEVIHDQDTIASWTRTVVTDTSGGGTTKRGRYAFAGTTTQGANSRLLYPRLYTESVDSEVRSLWADVTHYNATSGNSSGAGQLGHIHRLVQPGDGSHSAYVVWFDITFGLTNLLNLDVWTRTSGGVTNTAATGTGINGQLTGPRYELPILESKRVSNVVTYRVPMRHRLVAGDTIVPADTSVNQSNPTTAVTSESVTVASTGTDTLQGGSGWLYAQRRLFPAWVCSQLMGTRFRVKMWSAGSSEPGWGDSRYVFDWTNSSGVGPTTAGRSGVAVNHLSAQASGQAELGNIYVQNLDATVA